MGPVLVYSAVDAGITQLVECKLPKLDVASSSLVARSIFFLCGCGTADMFQIRERYGYHLS